MSFGSSASAQSPEFLRKKINLKFETLADAKTANYLRAFDRVYLDERVSGKGGKSVWGVISGTGSANGRNIVSHDALSLSLVLLETNKRDVLAWGFDPDVTASNDVVVGAFFASINDGDYIDFNGLMFRVYGSTTGILSSTATPATDRAQLLTEMAFLNGKSNITFSAGGLYAADAGTAPAKNYFPSTLYMKACYNITFESGSTFEAKGESWGDSDDSLSLSKDDRQDFIGQNGGHAIVAVRCRKIRGTPTARLAGSTGPLYFSSSDDIALDSPFVNSASLGYASYSFDAWCGDLTVTGFDGYRASILNPMAYKESLVRREDGITAVGSSVYCGKGGVITEDPDVNVVTFGGHIANMSANGASKQLGYAFGAGSGSTVNAHGPVIRDCQEAAYVSWSIDALAECNVWEMDAETGLTGGFIDNKSFGSGRMTLTGKLRVDNSKAWVGEDEPLSTTSVIACNKPVSIMDVVLDLDAAGNSETGGSIYSLINNNREACYGGVHIKGGRYETSGYIIRSQGWGGTSAGKYKGLMIDDGVIIKDLSVIDTDALIQYRSRSTPGLVSTYVYHDLENALISSAGFRSLSSGYVISSSALVEKRLMPKKLESSVFMTSSLSRPRETVQLEFDSVVGLVGSDSSMVFIATDNRPIAANSFINSDAGLIKVLSVLAVTAGASDLKLTLKLEGDVRTDFTISDPYTVLGG
tara:strand:+ start:7500 stop:9596 length:2097 start_codon:yes stop_codon:yes gene_type:complete